MSKKITTFEEYIYNKFLDLDFKKYINNKQYNFKSPIDLSSEYANDFIKIMNFLYKIVSTNKDEYIVLNQIYHKELIDISESYNEYHGLMIANILKADFISFINIHAGRLGKKNIISMFINGKNSAFIHALLNERMSCLNYLLQYVSVDELLVLKFNNLSVIEALFKISAISSIKFLIKNDYNCKLKTIILPHFLRYKLNTELVNSISKKYDIQLNNQERLYLGEIYSMSTSQSISFLNPLINNDDLLNRPNIISNIQLWDHIFNKTNDIKPDFIIHILDSNCNTDNIIHCIYKILQNIQSSQELECILLSSSNNILKLFTDINGDFVQPMVPDLVFHKYSRFFNFIKPYVNDELQSFINTSNLKYTDYVQCINKYTNKDIGKYIIDYV
jgi:hypothetical protein